MIRRMSVAPDVTLAGMETIGRTAGLFLLATLLIPLAALSVMIAAGAMGAFSAMLRGSVVEMAPYVTAFRLSNLLYAAAWLCQLLGFGLLSGLLLRQHGGLPALLAFILILVAAILGVLEATFHMSVTSWVAKEAAATGSVPDHYFVMRRWVSSFQAMHLFLGLLALTGYGWALLRTDLVPAWVGGGAVAWGLLWLVALLLGAGAPAVLFIMPAVIGVALLRPPGP